MKDIRQIQNLLGKANTYLENHQYDEAINALNKITTNLDKTLLSGIWGMLGDAYFHKGEYSNAIKILTKALEYVPVQIRGQPLSLLGQSLFWNKQYKDAIKVFDEIIVDICPDTNRFPPAEDLFLFYNFLGDAYIQLNKYKKAIDAFELALTSKSDYEESQHNLVFAQFKQGHSKSATINIKDETRWWNFFAIRLQTDGLRTGILWHFDSALISCQKALELDPEDEDTKNALKVIQHNRGLFIKKK